MTSVAIPKSGMAACVGECTAEVYHTPPIRILEVLCTRDLLPIFQQVRIIARVRRKINTGTLQSPTILYPRKVNPRISERNREAYRSSLESCCATPISTNPNNFASDIGIEIIRSVVSPLGDRIRSRADIHRHKTLLFLCMIFLPYGPADSTSLILKA
jgi:hypothetical protein